jgi:hypothetical protein
LFVIVPAAEGAVTVTVISGAAPTAKLAARSQVTTPAASLQLQSVPLALTKLTPPGKVSETLTPLAAEGPLFVTLKV